MKTQKLISMILVILTVAYCGIALLFFDASSSVEILCVSGSEAESWAKRHGAEYRLISDSELTSVRLHLGTFDYDLKNGGCSIVGCNSVSSEIVIPEEIDGYPVIGVEKTAFDGCDSVTAVYVPKTVTYFVPLHTERYVVYCYKDSDVYDLLQTAAAKKAAAEKLKAAAEAAPGLAAEAEKEAQACAEEAEAAEIAAQAAQEAADAAVERAAEPDAAEDVKAEAEKLAEQAAALAAIAEEKRALADAAAETAAQKQEEAQKLAERLAKVTPETFVATPRRLLRDSDPVNFDAANIPFAYSQTENGVEVTAYTGQAARIVVPETIDGISVTAVSFPVEGSVRSVFIPESVTDIRAPLAEPRYNGMFFFNLALVILGLMIALIATNLAAKRGETAEQRFLGISLVYSGVKYFILLLIWTAVSLFYEVDFLLQAAVGVVLLTAAPIELAVAGYAGQKVEKIGAEIRQNTAFIHAYRAKAEQLEVRAAEAVRPYCKDLAEAFRYADPVSHASLLAAEEQIAAKFETFSDAVLAGNEAAAKELAKELLVLVDERNRTCKLLK